MSSVSVQHLIMIAWNVFVFHHIMMECFQKRAKQVRAEVSDFSSKNVTEAEMTPGQLSKLRSFWTLVTWMFTSKDYVIVSKIT